MHIAFDPFEMHRRLGLGQYIRLNQVMSSLADQNLIAFGHTA